jgi:hypothetical protein
MEGSVQGSTSHRCWWFNCAEDATTVVTANDVTRVYCEHHAQRVEDYYEAAARWEMAADV